MQLAKVSNTKGFTLVEIMIVVSIIAVLGAIAIPQYNQYVVKGKRAAAQAFMVDVAGRQKQYLLDARAYAPSLAVLVMTEPPEVAKNYTFSMTVPAVIPPTFLITETPIAGKPQAGDVILTLDDAGVKTPAAKW